MSPTLRKGVNGLGHDDGREIKVSGNKGGCASNAIREEDPKGVKEDVHRAGFEGWGLRCTREEEEKSRWRQK